MENALTRMQREIEELRRNRGDLNAKDPSYYETRDGEGYSPPAPAPPKPPSTEAPLTPSLARPQLAGELGGALKVQTIDLEGKVMHTTYGDFPLDADGAAVIAGIAVAALQTHFNAMVEQAARAYGIWSNVPASTAAAPIQSGATDVLTTQRPATPSATSTAPGAGATSRGGTRRKGRRGN